MQLSISKCLHSSVGRATNLNILIGGIIIYKCKICGREFEKSHSLGGHISSHYGTHNNNKKIRSITLCEYCGNSIEYSTRKHRFCSIQCKTLYNRNLKENSLAYINGEQVDLTNKEITELRKSITQCQICGKSLTDISNEHNKFNNLCIDHDHISGKVRGLLCMTCNVHLGWYENNKEKVLEYLNHRSSVRFRL